MSYKFTDEDRTKAQKVKDLRILKTVFKKNSHKSHHYMKRLLLEYMNFEYKCKKCGIIEWNNKELKLQLDHINGDGYNNEVDNLRFLCPNCHSQTESYCTKANTGSYKVTNDEMIKAIKKNTNIRRTLISVGLTPKGGNYVRVRELMSKHELEF